MKVPYNVPTIVLKARPFIPRISFYMKVVCGSCGTIVAHVWVMHINNEESGDRSQKKPQNWGWKQFWVIHWLPNPSILDVNILFNVVIRAEFCFSCFSWWIFVKMNKEYVYKCSNMVLEPLWTPQIPLCFSVSEAHGTIRAVVGPLAPCYEVIC